MATWTLSSAAATADPEQYSTDRYKRWLTVGHSLDAEIVIDRSASVRLRVVNFADEKVENALRIEVDGEVHGFSKGSGKSFTATIPGGLTSSLKFRIFVDEDAIDVDSDVLFAFEEIEVQRL